MPGNRLHKHSFGYGLLLAAGWGLHRAYYRKFVVKGRKHIPKNGPVLFAASHQNALMDALAVIYAARRQIVFLARADIFRRNLISSLLRFLKILPVYRIRDGYSSLGQNQETFDQVFKILKHNRTVGLFPEGFHEGKKKLKPLRKGIARMAFQAEEKTDFSLGLQIVPVGLDYSDYFLPGSDLLVIFGEPIRVADYRDHYRENPSAAIIKLRDDLAAAMREIMIDIPDDDHYETILSNAMQKSVFELKKRGMRTTLYNRYMIIKELCNEMSSRGTFRGTFPSAPPLKVPHPASKFIKYSLLFLLSPLFILGTLINIIPALIADHVSRGVKDPHLAVSVRFGAGFFLYILWHVMIAIAALVIIPELIAAVFAILLVPVSGIIALQYSRHFHLIYRYLSPPVLRTSTDRTTGSKQN